MSARFFFTTHAKERMAERGITEAHIRALSVSPTTKCEAYTKGGKGSFRIVGTVNRRPLAVCVFKTGNGLGVSTVFWQDE